MTANSTQQHSKPTGLVWPLKAVVGLETFLRPCMGWAVLLLLSLLAMLPAFTLRINHWVRLYNDQFALEMTGPLSICTVWLLLGWRTPRRAVKHAWLRGALLAIIWTLIGCLIIAQVAIAWLPGPLTLITAVIRGDMAALAFDAMGEWTRFGDRIRFWLLAVQAGTAKQDRLIFLTLASIVAWTVAGLSALIARNRRSGLAAAFPLLWLLGAILLYSSGGRFLFVFALGATLALHLAVDQGQLVVRWRALDLDYNAGIYLDRFLLVIGASLLLLTAAAVAPNLYYQPVVNRYYAQMKPYYTTMEDTAERLFPGVRGTSRLGGGLGGGLPNEFLLSSGPELTDTIVMYVQTDEPVPDNYPYDYVPPISHYMRGGTFSQYDGQGWRNSSQTTKEDVAADTQMTVLGDGARRPVVQQVSLQFRTQVAYAAAEPLELTMDLRQEFRTPGDIVALWAREESYTAVSLVPAVDTEALNQVGNWSDQNPLPAEYEIYLALPDTVSTRTIELAQSIVAGEDTLYGQAQALERYLRGYEYDLNVNAVPDDVADVTDYFLFDLQRGYCDYYATSFVVMARAVGIPARFATGYAPGGWNPEENLWSIREADAHSWPEVLFPEYGWIPFEPTAALPELSRIGLPTRAMFTAGQAQPAEETTGMADSRVQWNWQMLFWLLPLAGVAWGVWKLVKRIRRSREQPWPTLLRWGGQVGRPIAEGETVLEYGDGLAAFVVESQYRQQDLARVAASEMRAMAQAVSDSSYAGHPVRNDATERVDRHWRTLREYLSPLRRSR